MNILAKAKLNHLRLAPRKVRLVTNLISGMEVAKAELQLRFLNKRAARSVLKLLQSASANAKSNYGLEKQDLVIKQIFVNQGPTLKRWMPRAMGRATPIMKRTSHIELGLEAKPGVKVKKINSQEKDNSKSQPEVKKQDLQPIQNEGSSIKEKDQEKPTGKIKPERPYHTTPEAKKRFFSRQTPNQAKKDFKRKTG